MSRAVSDPLEELKMLNVTPHVIPRDLFPTWRDFQRLCTTEVIPRDARDDVVNYQMR